MGRLVPRSDHVPATIELIEATPAKATSSYRKPAIIGMALILAVFGGLGSWSAIAPIEGAAIALGVVTVESKKKAVQHMEGGIIKEILVRDGDVVKKGDVLVRLDDTRSRTALQIIRGQLDAARGLAARLVAERDDKDRIAFPDELLKRASDTNVSEILKGQQALFNARRESKRGEIEILEQRVRQLREEIGGLQAQQRARGDQIRLIQDELNGLVELFEKGFAPKTRILALQREAARLTGERGQDIAQISRAEKSIGESQLRILQIRKEIQEKVAAELREVQDRMYDLEERAVATRDQLDRTVVTAPVDGAVMGRAIHTEGGVVQPAGLLMYVVPSDDRLIIEAQLEVMHVDEVKIGEVAEVRFSSLNLRKLPVIVGTLEYISADRSTDERTGIPFYNARIEVPESELAKLKDQKISAGMPADVFIKTGARTPLDYILTPVLQSMNRSFREP